MECVLSIVYNKKMDDERLKTLGLNIKFARIKAKISQEALAEMVSVSRETISMIETGNQNTTVLRIFDIASALNVDFSELFKDI